VRHAVAMMRVSGAMTSRLRRGNAEGGEIDDDDALRGVEDDLVALGV